MKKLDALVKALYARPALQLEIAGSIDPASDRDGLQRLALEKQLRTRQWQSLGKSDRATTTPDQIVLTPDATGGLGEKTFQRGEAGGKITPALIAANTNLSAAVAQIIARKASDKKGAELLMKASQTGASKSSGMNAVSAQSKLAPPADPMEVLLLATFPISEGDLETLATGSRQGSARLHSSNRPGGSRAAFPDRNQTGGVRSDGSRVYLQFQ